MTPVVPTSRRCTMPCRSAAPEVATRLPSAASPPTTVGPVQPGLGCAATPTGLSTTTMSSSSYSTVMPPTSSGGAAMTAGASGVGSSTSSQLPAVSRSDLPAARPSSAIIPSSARVATTVRDMPRSRDRPASTRMPSRPSGTGSWRTSLTGGLPLRRVGPGPVELAALQREGAQQDPAADDARVGQVEHREERAVGPDHGDDVDDVALQRPRRPEDPVDEVPQRTAEHEAERDRPTHRPQLPRDPDDHQHHAERDDR